MFEPRENCTYRLNYGLLILEIDKYINWIITAQSNYCLIFTWNIFNYCIIWILSLVIPFLSSHFIAILWARCVWLLANIGVALRRPLKFSKNVPFQIWINGQFAYTPSHSSQKPFHWHINFWSSLGTRKLYSILQFDLRVVL